MKVLYASDARHTEAHAREQQVSICRRKPRFQPEHSGRRKSEHHSSLSSQADHSVLVPLGALVTPRGLRKAVLNLPVLG